MKLLAFSDIHDNLVSVRKMRAQENNEFDAIVIAGDIGSEKAEEFFRILSSFACPIVYVYGNWDSRLEYDHSFGSGCFLLQMNVVICSAVAFAGYSGCPTKWGRNPIAQQFERRLHELHSKILEPLAKIERQLATRQQLFFEDRDHFVAQTRRRRQQPVAVQDLMDEWDQKLARIRQRVKHMKEGVQYQRYVADWRISQKEILRLNRLGMLEAINNARMPRERIIVVTHERTPREYLGQAALHLFGHNHGFADHAYMATRYVNVSALDRAITARPRSCRKPTQDDYRNMNGGSYTIIEIRGNGEIATKCIVLPHNYKKWIPVSTLYHGLQWIPEEERFVSAEI